jgi:hypothetical protein
MVRAALPRARAALHCYLIEVETIPVLQSGRPMKGTRPMTSSAHGQSPDPGSDSGFGGFDAQDMRMVHNAFGQGIRLIGEMAAAVAPGGER